MKTIKPFLKWVGGKTQIIEDVINKFPKSMNNYHEPFLGGGSVLLALLSQKNEDYIIIENKIYASDANENLINLYINIKDNVEEFIKEISKITKIYSKLNSDGPVNRKPLNEEEALKSQESYYYYIRNIFNNSEPSVLKSAYFLFLNKTCFRGIYREGPNGFNVPFGHYKNVSIYEEEHLKEVSEIIQPVIFRKQSFVESFCYCENGDFVYLDPPYVPEKATSFVGYTSDGFDLTHHQNLFKICNVLIKDNIKYLMSNSNTLLVVDSFKDQEKVSIDAIVVRRAINSKSPDATTSEVLIKNY
jgi:DNA adenine methylase